MSRHKSTWSRWKRSPWRKSQRDFQRVGADGFFQTGHAILAAFHVEEPSVARVVPSVAALFFFSRVRFGLLTEAANKEDCACTSA